MDFPKWFAIEFFIPVLTLVTSVWLMAVLLKMMSYIYGVI